VRYVLLVLLAAVPVAAAAYLVGDRGPAREAPSLARVTPGAAPADAARAPDAGLPAAASNPDVPAELAPLFREPLAGAAPKAKVLVYRGDRLFDYVDGAAPLYLERGFQVLVTAELATADGRELTCDVFDLGTPAGAAGILAAEGGAEGARPLSDWPQALVRPQSIVFTEGRFYVKLTAFDGAGESLLPDVARALRARLPRS
jgi:hypothetical protein